MNASNSRSFESIQLEKYYNRTSQRLRARGLLRTDKNYHLNFQINIKTDQKGIFIKQGQPLALIVPYKRETYKSKIVDLNEKNKFSIQYHKHYLKTYGSFKMNFRKDYWSEE